MSEHVLFCIIGRTASGKDSLVNKLSERAGARQLISYTTRERRDGEGATHVFVSEEQYWSMISVGEVAVDTKIAGNYYWSTIEQLYETDVYVVDYIGYQKLQQLNLPDIRLVSVFINVPDDIREIRALNSRKDNKLVFRRRNLDEAAQFRDMLRNADFDYSIKNIDFAKAYSVLRWIYDLEGGWKNHMEDDTK